MIKNEEEEEEENIQNYLRNERMWRHSLRQAHTYTKWKTNKEKERARDT